MINLPPRPKGALPSLREARNAHPHPHPHVNKGTAGAGALQQQAFESSQQFLRYDSRTRTLQKFGASGGVVSSFVPEAPRRQGESVDILTQAAAELADGPATTRYNLRKRKADDSTAEKDDESIAKKARITNINDENGDSFGTPSMLGLGIEAGLSRKRSRTDDDEFEDGKVIETADEPPVDTQPPTKKRKKNKHKPHGQKKAKTEAALEMVMTDLVPHYRPTKVMFTKSKGERLAKEIVRKPTTFMDLNEDVRRVIWEKVFEDEAYRFKCLRYCSRDSWKHMVSKLPPSFGCLLINKQFGAEAAEDMFKSVRLELDFGKLRPNAVQDFMDKIGESKLGEKCERIFFVRKFGLQRVNFGRFKRAREIVSEYWTVEGSKSMDHDDYSNNRIDPAFILETPEGSKENGFKQRKAWSDHRRAFDRYQAHIENRCHPLMKDPGAVDFDEAVDRKGCPWDGACTNLRKTLFVIALKYKFGRIKGRHARHKEVRYDFYPASGDREERLVRVSPFKSKFHKKLGKKDPRREKTGDGDDDEEGQE